LWLIVAHCGSLCVLVYAINKTFIHLFDYFF